MKYYTMLKQDGETQLIHKGDEMSLEQLQNEIGDPNVELIPRAYYPQNMNGLVWGAEMARMNLFNTRNPHMLVIDDYDVVGDLLLEQTEKQYTKWNSK